MDWKLLIRAALASAPDASREEVVEELAQHADALYTAARADGRSHAEAHRLAVDQIDRWRTEAAVMQHRSRRPPVIEPPPAVSSSRFIGLAQDIRYSWRQLRRQPRQSLLTILTMAVAIGVTTVLFSVTYGVLVRPLPWPRADRLVVLTERRGGNLPRFGAFTNAAYLAWDGAPTTIDGLAAWSQRSVTLSGAGEPERIRITAASASLFPALGAYPLVGSLFGPENETAPVLVLSERLWRQRFGADAAAIGSPLQLDGIRYTVVGVLPDRFAYPDRQSLGFVPSVIPPAADGALSVFNAIAVLRSGVTAAQASAEATAMGRASPGAGLVAMAIFGSDGPIEVAAQPLREALTADVRRPLVVLLVAVALLLATATANVANLQLAGAITRRRELAIRAALGAGNARITRQLLVEGLSLGLTGGAVGLALTWVMHRSLLSVLPPDFPRLDDLGLNATVLLFTVLVSVGTSVAVGLVPARGVRRLDIIEALADDGRVPAGAGTPSAGARVRALIMIGQVAIACVLLVGASLLGRSFLTLLTLDRGYDPGHILSARLAMPAALYPEPERRFALTQGILDRLRTIPAVTEAAFTSELPLTPGGSTAAFTLKPRHAGDGVISVQASPRIVSPRYFSTLGMRMVSGRGLSETDTEASEPVVIVNQTFARRYLGDLPLGAKLPLAGYASSAAAQTEWTVVGVVGDVRYAPAAQDSQPEIYYSHRQMGSRLPVQTVTFLLRTTGDPSAAAAALRTAVLRTDPHLVADAVLPLDERLRTTLARPRLYAMLLGGFAGSALIVAGVGLFGLLSYTVSQRSRELAIRVALGARSTDIVRLVVGQGLSVTLVGLLAGMLASAWLARLLSTLLYGLSPYDRFTFAMVPLLVLVIATVACVVPARRAVRQDPQRLITGA